MGTCGQLEELVLEGCERITEQVQLYPDPPKFRNPVLVYPEIKRWKPECPYESTLSGLLSARCVDVRTAGGA
eukprot:2857766-Rhodomonas_salina.1